MGLAQVSDGLPGCQIATAYGGDVGPHHLPLPGPRKAGESGIGVVCRAEDIRLKRTVALSPCSLTVVQAPRIRDTLARSPTCRRTRSSEHLHRL